MKFTNGIYVTSPNIVNYIDTAIIAKDIETSKVMKPDAIIACMHWGIEYQSLPDKEQKFLADWLIQKGVNHVIGSHPHVVQPIEVREDSVTNDKHLVVYSLGNYISNMSARHTDGGLMVKMELVKDSITRLNKCEYSLVWTARPTQSGKKNHQLLPVNLPTDSIPVNARYNLKHQNCYLAVIPANAGVILFYPLYFFLFFSYPRECGGDPVSGAKVGNDIQLSPRMRRLLLFRKAPGSARAGKDLPL